jgi:hypothetical protein
MSDEATAKAAAESDSKTATGRAGGAGMALGSLAAVASIFAALSCCLPVLPFVLAAGLAGSSAFLIAARPYLVAASILFIGYGFFAAGRAKKCRRRSSRVAIVLLWTAAGIVFVSLFFPQAMANAAADLLGR